MRRYSIIAAFLMALPGLVTASPRAVEGDGFSSLFSARDLSAWHIGGYYRRLKRDIDFPLMDTTRLELNRAVFYTGYNITPWLTVYGLAGNIDPHLVQVPGGGSSGTEIGGGLWINLLDHELVDQLQLENRISVEAMAQYSRGNPEFGDFDLTYSEVQASLTLSIINDVSSGTIYWPETVSLFFGPVYNHLNSSDFDQANNEFGLCIGSDIGLSRRVRLSLAYEKYDRNDDSLSAVLNIRL